jgi:hypothetical protein
MITNSLIGVGRSPSLMLVGKGTPLCAQVSEYMCM